LSDISNLPITFIKKYNFYKIIKYQSPYVSKNEKLQFTISNYYPFYG